MMIIFDRDLEFLEEAKNWRNEVWSKGEETYTYRNKENTHIALFDGDTIEVFELGRGVAIFLDIK